MELINHLPESSGLRPDSFKTWDTARPESTRVTLGSDHSVYGQFGGRDVSGISTVSYVIESRNTPAKPQGSLKVGGRVPAIGVQSSDELRAMMEEVRPRQSFTLASVSTGAYDMRALAYVCGNVAACTASGRPVNMADSGVAEVRLMHPSWTIPSRTELILSPGVCRNSQEFATLLRLSSVSGCTTIQAMGDALPPDARTLEGPALGLFALRLFSTILGSAQASACADHHLLAFFRGQCSALKLWGHTDEGGWVREPLRSANYPPSCGVLYSATGAMLGIPCSESLPPRYLTRTVLSMFLECVGYVVTSDPTTQPGVPCVLSRIDAGSKPSSFDGLREQFYEMTSIWRSQTSTGLGLHRSDVVDESSTGSFFSRDPEDRHLTGDRIAPFFWVEPSCITVSDRGNIPIPATQGKATTLPFAHGAKVWKTKSYVEDRGFVAGTGRVYVSQEESIPRRSAYSYILSGRYRAANGLDLCEYALRPELGVYTKSTAFGNQETDIVSLRRWKTPHNPLPSGVENTSGLRTCFSFTYRGRGKEPTASDWESGTFGSLVGGLYVSPPPSLVPKVTHTAVPDVLRGWLDRTNGMGLVSVDTLMEEIDRPGPAPPSGVSPPESASPGMISEESPVTAPPPIPEVPGAPPGPPTNVRIDAQAGIRQQLPATEPPGLGGAGRGHPTSSDD